MKLNKNQKIDGSLDLRGTQISSLPEGLHVGEWLDLRGTQISSLPEGLHVGGSLDLRGTPLFNRISVNNCGDKKRTIYAWNDSIDGQIISIGCFRGSKEQAISAIRENYTGGDADTYCAKVEEAFQKIQS